MGERQYFEESDKRLQCTKPRNETVRADSDTVVSHLTADQLNLVILNSQEAGIKLIHHYARLTIQAENRLAVYQQANKDLAKTAAQAEKALGEANAKLAKALAEVTTLTDRNNGQAAAIGQLQDEMRDQGLLLTEANRHLAEQQAELTGLRTDLATANRELAERSELLKVARPQIAGLMSRVKELAHQLDESRMAEAEAMTQLGDEQRAKLAAEDRAHQAVNALVQLETENGKRGDRIATLERQNDALRQSVERLEAEAEVDRQINETVATTIEGLKNELRMSSPAAVRVEDVRRALAEHNARTSNRPPSLDLPSDTQPNAAVQAPEVEEPALTLHLDTFIGKPPTKPATEPEPPKPNRFDEPTGRIGLDDIEVIGTTSPKKPA